MIDVIVPYRPADDSRIRGFNLCMAMWDHVDAPARVLIGGDGGFRSPFNKARAVNRLVASSNAEKILLYGSDHLPPSGEKLAEISVALDNFPWVGCFSQHSVLTPHAVQRLWSDVVHERWPLSFGPTDLSTTVPIALGVIAVTRDAWQQCGGLDERFHGWGAEDVAIREVLNARHGSFQLTGAVVSTPHPAASRAYAERNMGYVEEYRRAIDGGRLREYLDETVEVRGGQIPAS